MTETSSPRVLSVVGARPNFMKVGPLHRAFEAAGFDSLIVHTGQHYDEAMSDVFFEQLELPEPDLYLGIGSDSHARQTARIMTAFEEVLTDEAPDLVVVVGDVNSTLACSLVAAKEQVPVAHVEAGLRSGDRTMPEELNRIVTDSLSDYLFVTEKSGVQNLRAEGVPEDKVHFTGNVMIDSLVRFREKAQQTTVLEDLGLEDEDFILMTMHRPSNVDRKEKLQEVVQAIREIAAMRRLVFPMHPRTRASLEQHDLWEEAAAIEGLQVIGPQGYLEFLRLMERADVVVTDSGGIQEETTYLQVPCVTVRENTERPSTIEEGTNELTALEDAPERVRARLAGEHPSGTVPEKWDGQAARRIAEVLTRVLRPSAEVH